MQRRKFGREFKIEAVRLIKERGTKLDRTFGKIASSVRARSLRGRLSQA